MSDPTTLARAYYRTIDDDDYEELAAILAPEFTHERPDRTLDGRDRFVAFMRDERPATDTTHVVDAVYEADPGASGSPGDSVGVAAQGRLLGSDGETMFGFVDVFAVEAGRLRGATTYVRTDDAD
jgi:Nuclear transport factor 2 (NTF2) domain.